jgi:hypothetical protein
VTYDSSLWLGDRAWVPLTHFPFLNFCHSPFLSLQEFAKWLSLKDRENKRKPLADNEKGD